MGEGGGRLDVKDVPVETRGLATVDGTGVVLAITGELLFTFSPLPILRFFIFSLNCDAASSCKNISLQ